MSRIKVEIDNDIAALYTPYNATFVSKIKKISGRKWNGEAWTIPTAELDNARKIMLECYGETDIDIPTETIDIKLTITEDIDLLTEGIYLFGKSICYATGRDSGAKYGDGVSLIEGKAYSGGSVKNWRTCVNEGTVFTVRNVLENKLNDIPKYMENCFAYEIIEKGNEQKIKDLEKIKAELELKLSEINRQLEELKKATN